MGTTGLIFGAIVIAWLAYLVPLYLRRNSEVPEESADPANRFSESVQIIRSGAANAVDQDLNPISGIEISTPLTRRAAIDEIRRMDETAARRRRRVLGVLGLVFLSTVVLSAAGVTPWWSLAIPGVLIVGFVAVARYSVQVMRRDLDARLDRIRNGGEEDTVRINRADLAKGDPRKKSAAGSVELGAPSGKPGTLWDPLPITRPTYVSAPLAPRTVRTIDLSAPAAPAEVPVVADAPERPVVVGDGPAQAAPVSAGTPVGSGSTRLPRAVGE